MKDINWDEAPEGATHHGQFKEHWSWYRLLDDQEWAEVYNKKGKLESTCWKSSTVKDGNGGCCRFTPRPDVKLIYTQEMSDKGELPSVGMECILSISSFAGIHSKDRMHDGDHCEIVAHIDGLAVAIVRDENGDICFTITANHAWFKPIPPEVELIDGKAYQFDFDTESVGGRGIHGVYLKDTNSLKSIDSYVNLEYCTNIVPLVPEVK